MPMQFKTAKMSDLQTPTTRIFFGDRLKEVQQIQNSIAKHGLLNPIRVMQRGKKLIVVDGKKRLAALRRMRFIGCLPHSLVNVPYVMVTQNNSAVQHMSLLSNKEKFEDVLSLCKKGYSLMEIASTLYVSKQCVKDILSVSRLSRQLQQAYFGGNISIDQARVFATLPNKNTQDMLFVALGSFANAPDILRAIRNGETVIDMGDENVIILPSRPIEKPLPLAA